MTLAAGILIAVAVTGLAARAAARARARQVEARGMLRARLASDAAAYRAHYKGNDEALAALATAEKHLQLNRAADVAFEKTSVARVLLATAWRALIIGAGSFAAAVVLALGARYAGVPRDPVFWLGALVYVGGVVTANLLDISGRRSAINRERQPYRKLRPFLADWNESKQRA
ncbi:MAG: hypothetical protein R3F39_03135 [Myxococcota bacterium]